MAQIPAGKTWFDTHKQSFTNVPIGSDQGVDTATFLEASEATTTLFGKTRFYDENLALTDSPRFVGLCSLHACQE